MLFRVLAPYLITVKGLDYDKAYSVLEQWLDKCNDVKRLEPDWTSFRYRISYCLDIAENRENQSNLILLKNIILMSTNP